MSCEFISELRRLSKLSAEAVQNLDHFDPLKKYMHITRHTEIDFKQLLLKIAEVNHKQLVLVCGSAGDGKSHLLSYLKYSEQDHILDSYTIINDATESDAPNQTAIETLAERIAAFRDDRLNDGGREKVVLAINLGMLNNFIDSEQGKYFGKLKQYVLNNNIFSVAQPLPFNKDEVFHHIDFSNYQLYTLTADGARSDYLTELFEKVFGNNTCNPFYNTYINQGSTCPHHTQCPVRHNFEFLMKEDVRKLLIQRIIEVCIKDKEAMREIQDESQEDKTEPQEKGSVECSENLTLVTPEPLKEKADDDREISVLFGQDQNTGMPLFWHPGNTDEVFHTNTGIIGTMGTGKTQFTQSLVAQLYRERVNNVESSDIGILIFDYKGDYNESKENFVKATNAKVLKPYHLPYNPLALTQPRVFKPLLPIHVANTFNDTLSRVYHLGPKQSSTLLNCIKSAYVSRGIIPNDPKTWTLPAPTFQNVYSLYMGDDDIKKGDSLEAALRTLADFEVFEADSRNTESLFDLLTGVVVIDISGYDTDLQNLIIAITLDLFYAQMQARGSSKLLGKHRQLTKMILVDEADNFLHEGFPSLKKILKEGREFGVGTILSTQFLKHFGSGDDDFSKYILTWVVHNVADLKNTDIRFVFNTEANSAEETKLFGDVKKLQKHYSIVKMGNRPKPIYIKDKAFWELFLELQAQNDQQG